MGSTMSPTKMTGRTDPLPTTIEGVLAEKEEWRISHPISYRGSRSQRAEGHVFEIFCLKSSILMLPVCWKNEVVKVWLNGTVFIVLGENLSFLRICNSRYCMQFHFPCFFLLCCVFFQVLVQNFWMLFAVYFKVIVSFLPLTSYMVGFFAWNI